MTCNKVHCENLVSSRVPILSCQNGHIFCSPCTYSWWISQGRRSPPCMICRDVTPIFATQLQHISSMLDIPADCPHEGFFENHSNLSKISFSIVFLIYEKNQIGLSDFQTLLKRLRRPPSPLLATSSSC